MANTKSAKKRIRQNSRRRARNAMVRTRARTRVRQARAAAGSGEQGADQAVKDAIRELDRAAAKGVIHPKNAARRKSRLLKAKKSSPASSSG